MVLAKPDPTASIPEDNESIIDLVKRAKEGDPLAFESLFLSHYPRIHSFLRHMVGNDEIASDLTQETFLEAHQSILKLRDESKFNGWLYRIAHNEALNYIRREEQFKNLLHLLPWPWYSDRTELMDMPGVEEREILKQALARVSPKYRACVILQIIYEMPQKEIAALLNISRNSVSNNVTRGLRQWKAAYQSLDYK